MKLINIIQIVYECFGQKIPGDNGDQQHLILPKQCKDKDSKPWAAASPH